MPNEQLHDVLKEGGLLHGDRLSTYQYGCKKMKLPYNKGKEEPNKTFVRGRYLWTILLHILKYIIKSLRELHIQYVVKSCMRCMPRNYEKR